MSKKTSRQTELLRIIEAQGLLPIKTLSSMLQVSEMTVRRDLQALQGRAPMAEGLFEDGTTAEGLGNGGDYSLLQALEKANQQKNRIGRFAASLIQPNDVIVIDTGSTTARILPHIPGDKNLTILCYNANVMLELRYKPGIQLLFCGGVYHQNTEMFESPESICYIERIRANKVFLSAAGIHRELGITCANAHEVPTKTAVIRSSQERILVADSGKFGQLRSSYFCSLDEVNTVVTDRHLSPQWQAFIKDKGITLHLV